jgi:hypothetical protein
LQLPQFYSQEPQGDRVKTGSSKKPQGINFPPFITNKKEENCDESPVVEEHLEHTTKSDSESTSASVTSTSTTSTVGLITKSTTTTKKPPTVVTSSMNVVANDNKEEDEESSVAEAKPGKFLINFKNS